MGDLRQLAFEPHIGEAEVDLSLAGRMRERQEHFPVLLPEGPDRVLDDGLPAVIAMLVPQSFEDPPGRVPLLAMHPPITLEIFQL